VLGARLKLRECPRCTGACIAGRDLAGELARITALLEAVYRRE
jgi:hypothetical protein